MDLSAFILHSTHGLKKFEELLREDAYCSVTEALSQTYGVLASQSLETKEDAPPNVTAPLLVSVWTILICYNIFRQIYLWRAIFISQDDAVGWLSIYKQHQQLAYVPAEKNRVGQDLWTATVAICCSLCEFGPCQCNLSQLFHLLACTDSELSNNRLYQGFNERDLNSTTRDSIYDHYITVGYKGTGVETTNNVVLLDNAELTALLTLEIFSAETELPKAKSKDELFALFCPQLEDLEKLNLLIQKWELFKPHFAKVKDADDKLGKRL